MPGFQFGGGGGPVFGQVGGPLIPAGSDVRGGLDTLRPAWEVVDEWVGLKGLAVIRDKPLGAGEENRIREELTRAAYGLHSSPEAVAAYLARLVLWMNAGGVRSGLQLPMWLADP